MLTALLVVVLIGGLSYWAAGGDLLTAVAFFVPVWLLLAIALVIVLPSDTEGNEFIDYVLRIFE
jgi:hypothetical protein